MVGAVAVRRHDCASGLGRAGVDGNVTARRVVLREGRQRTAVLKGGTIEEGRPHCPPSGL